MSTRSAICHLCGKPVTGGLHQKQAGATERLQCAICEREYDTVCRAEDGTRVFRCPNGHRAKLTALK